MRSISKLVQYYRIKFVPRGRLGLFVAEKEDDLVSSSLLFYHDKQYYLQSTTTKKYCTQH